MPEKQARETTFFYDLNASLHFRLNQKNQLRLQAYNGNDMARFYQFIKVNWGNRIVSAEWLHSFNHKLLLSSSFHYSQYGYGFRFSLEDEVDFRWTSGLKEYSSQQDFDYTLSPNSHLSFGYNFTKRSFDPLFLRLAGNGSYNLSENINLDKKQVVEQALYIHHEHQIGEKLSLLYGLRYSFFHNLGPGKAFVYKSGIAKSLETITDTLQYGHNELYHTFHGAEPRIIGRYTINENSSVKFSYNRMQQYTQVASSATASLPTDRWIPSDQYLKPQIGDQWSAGYFKALNSVQLDLSAEVYYKHMRNQIDFKDGVRFAGYLNNQTTSIQFNNSLETQLLSGKAWSYGLELMLRKKKGRLTGWLAYSLSQTRRQIEGINRNKPYSPRYDRPHDFSLVGNYKLSKRLEVATTWVYTSGSALTLPEGKYTFEDRQLPYYNPQYRNNSRLPAYHRLDLSFTIHNKKNEERRWKSNWSFSLYNAYMRKNPLFIQFMNVINNDPLISEADAVKVKSKELKGVKVFFSIIPAVSYNFRF